MKKIKSPHLDVRQNWLNKLKEQPLLPDLNIIDPHHHLWDVGFGKYYVEELLEDIKSSGHNVKATVYIMSSSNTKIYFKSINELNQSLALKELSMGMSSDYLIATKYLSTYVRIGSNIFGARS